MRRRGGSALPARSGNAAVRQPSLLHIVEGLQRWRGRSQHDGHATPLCTQQGQIARGVAETAFLLLVRGIMLFIDDDESQVVEWA